MGAPFLFGGTLSNVDTLVVNLSDMHSGSSVALFPPVLWKFGGERNHTPTEAQKRLYKHFMRCAAEAKRLRGNKRMLIVHNGDAIDGYHHQTVQVLTLLLAEQKELHINLMSRFLKAAGFDHGAGDRLIYVKGTEVHTKETEEEIAVEMGAEYKKAHDFIELKINGRRIWYLHQGAGSADGPNAGDTLRNWLKRTYWEYVNRRRVLPDMIVSGHYHKPVYNVYYQMRDGNPVALRGLILPSWQMKTRYVWGRAPVTVNEVGAAFYQVLADGVIVDPSFMTMETQNGVYLDL